MAIPVPNYTETPNILFDFWMCRLSGAEWKVICCLSRKIFGWHKSGYRDRISLSQIEKLTGLDKKSVLKSTEKLIEVGLIKKFVGGSIGQEQTVYEMIVSDNSNNSDQWNFSTGQNYLKKSIPLVKQQIQKSLTSGIFPHTKEIATKQTNHPSHQKQASHAKEMVKEVVAPRVVVESLKKLNITDSLRVSLSKKHSVAEIDLSVERVLRWKTRRSDAAAIITALAEINTWEDRVSEAKSSHGGRFQKQIIAARQIIKEHGEKCPSVAENCCIYEEDVVVNIDGKSYIFLMSDTLFEEKLNNCIRVLNERLQRTPKRH